MRYGYDTINNVHWKTGQASRQVTLAHKLKRTENVLNGNEMTETGMKVPFCKKNKIV